MSAVAIRSGQRFRFPEDDKVYVFHYIDFDNGEPHIYFWEEGQTSEKLAIGFYLHDLIKVH